MWSSVTVSLYINEKRQGKKIFSLQAYYGFFLVSVALCRNVPREDQLQNQVGRAKRDLVFENMVMRTHNSTTRKKGAKPVVGGGILERKIIIASNGTQRTHHESRGEVR